MLYGFCRITLYAVSRPCTVLIPIRSCCMYTLHLEPCACLNDTHNRLLRWSNRFVNSAVGQPKIVPAVISIRCPNSKCSGRLDRRGRMHDTKYLDKPDGCRQDEYQKWVVLRQSVWQMDTSSQENTTYCQMKKKDTRKTRRPKYALFESSSIEFVVPPFQNFYMN